MLPTYGFDWPPVPDDIDIPLRKGNLRLDYAWGETNLGGNPPAGRKTLWTFRLSGNTITGNRANLAPLTIYQENGISEMSVDFDREMQPVVAYMVNNNYGMVRHFDAAQNGFVLKTLPPGAHSPRVTYDLRAAAADGVAEVVVGYVLGKDIWVLESINNFTRPRLAASYLQDLYLDQISFAANNRLRFIVYQLTRPEDLPEVNPVPQSKYSTFIYRRKYTGSNPPVLPDDVATFSSVGLKYVLNINEPSTSAPAVRVYPLSICLRPEHVDSIIAKNAKDDPILRITKTFSVGLDTDKTYSLNQLTAMGGMVYDPEIKMYRFTFDHRTDGPNKRSIIVNFTDLIVNERTTLVIDESIAIPA